MALSRSVRNNFVPRGNSMLGPGPPPALLDPDRFFGPGVDSRRSCLESPARPTHASPGFRSSIERCELLPLVRDTSSGFTKVSIVVRPQRRRPRRRGRGHHVGPDRPDRVPAGRGPPQLAARGAHVRRVLDAARPGRPLPGRADPRQRPLLPPVGVRERGAGPRPAPERALAAGRRRPAGPAGQLRGVGPDRGPAEPRPAARAARRGPRAPLQARPDAQLGRRPRRGARAPGLRRRGRHEGPLPQRHRGDGRRRPASTAA